jgi:hypothetical protein
MVATSVFRRRTEREKETERERQREREREREECYLMMLSIAEVTWHR